MAIRSRSFSGKLLKRIRSKTKLDEPPVPTPVPPLPVSILPGLDVDASLGAPFGSPSTTSPILIPPKLHRRSRSFSELLSIASNSSGISHAQPWRDREAWAAIHSPSQGPVKSRKEGSVMDRSYGWMERLEHEDQDHRRPIVGRDEFRFFHNTPLNDLAEEERIRSINPHHTISRLNDPVTTVNVSRPSSDSSSTISTMDLSINNPATPPTSTDPHSPLRRSIPRSPASATSRYSTEDLPLPPLLPHNVKRADTPPAFTSGTPAQVQVPWAQRSTMRDIREASNLRWASSGSGSSSSSSTPNASAIGHPALSPLKASLVEPMRTPEPRVHRRKRSTTAPSVFANMTQADGDSRPESGALPHHPPSPPRPPRHPKRQYNPPPPLAMPVPRPTPATPQSPMYAYMPQTPSSHSHSFMPRTPSSRDEEWSTPLSSPSPLGNNSYSPTKGPSAYYKPTLPLRSAASYQSLRPSSRRPSTAPTNGSVNQGLMPVRQFGMKPLPSPIAIKNGSLSRNVSATSSTGRGGWI